MSQITLFATAAGRVALKCRATTITFTPASLEKLIPRLKEFAELSHTDTFHQNHFFHYSLFSGLDTVAIADLIAGRVIFLTTTGALTLVEYAPRFCALARLLAQTQSPEPVLVTPSSALVN